MKKQNNITYLLGAGASYNSIPISEKFNDALNSFTKAVNDVLRTEPSLRALYLSMRDPVQPTITKTSIEIGVNDLFSNLLDFSRSADTFNTIDIYARKLFLQNKKSKLSKLKTTISLFLAIWQQMEEHTVEKNQLNVAGVGDINEKYIHKYKDIDPRYITLLSYFLKRVDDNSILIDDNISFISWNYDVQLEMALGEFIDKDNIDEIIDEYSVYPNINDVKNPGPYRIVHLNGIAGLYETTQNETTYVTHTLFNRIPKNSSFKELVKELSFVLESFRHRSISMNRTFSYAWEDDDKSEMAIKEACRIMSETDVLVIIGYSFPAFNKDVDKRIFKYLQDGKKVFYQDPNANAELLKNRFGIMDKMISLEKDVKQFTIPLHYL